MKILLTVLTVLTINMSFINAAEKKCVTTLQKLKPECNIGKAFDKMKEFSKKNKTIDQSLGVSKEGKKKFNLKEWSSKNKTIKETIENSKKK